MGEPTSERRPRFSRGTYDQAGAYMGAGWPSEPPPAVEHVEADAAPWLRIFGADSCEGQVLVELAVPLHDVGGVPSFWTLTGLGMMADLDHWRPGQLSAAVGLLKLAGAVVQNAGGGLVVQPCRR